MLLRRTALDELPQLINVALGHMSLVGPRPERPEFVELFDTSIRRYDDRHRVKSGMTGWAQVHGLRGQTSLSERVEWDNWYIQNWSLWLDFKILLLTPLEVLRSRSEARGFAATVRWVSDLDAINEAARALAAGDLSVRVPEDGDDDARALARSFNAMAASLQESERSRDEFFALVSHELRTPLTSIIGYVQLVLDDEALGRDARRFLQIVHRNGQRLLRLVGDMLFVAQVEAGRLSLDREPVACGRSWSTASTRRVRRPRTSACTWSSSRTRRVTRTSSSATAIGSPKRSTT